MAIAAGSLTERITLQKATVTRNSIGEEVAGWTDIITGLPAAVRWLKGSRALTFGDVWNPATVKITCRYREAFEEAERILWHGKEFTVVSAFGDRVNMNMTITADLYHEGMNADEPEPTVPVYLTAWKIVGNSEVYGDEIWSCGEPITESLILFDGTYELSKGWLPTLGEYPTSNSSYPNAKYYVFDVKAGYIITTNITDNIRLRIIDNGIIVAHIRSGLNNSYVTSTYDPISATTGYVIVKQDCQIGLLVLDSTKSYAGSIIDSYIKYHILVQPTDKQSVDIVLDEPLRKVNDIADTLEYPLGTSGKALLTTRVAEIDGELTPLVTPAIALVDVPQIEESTEYSNVITPGSKAVEWSEFSTDSEVTT